MVASQADGAYGYFYHYVYSYYFGWTVYCLCHWTAYHDRIGYRDGIGGADWIGFRDCRYIYRKMHEFEKRARTASGPENAETRCRCIEFHIEGHVDELDARLGSSRIPGGPE